jgi:peptidoglycan/LPS O-acetylase OafA/YrhL
MMSKGGRRPVFDLAKRLQRRTTTGNWIPEIDGLRFIAIITVVLFHLNGELKRHGMTLVQDRYVLLDRFFTAGYRGVGLFFTISGYILGRPFAAHYLHGKARPSLRKYFLRRVTRLEPPYIFNLLAAAAALLLLDHVSWRIIGPHLLASIFYVHHLSFPASFFSINSVAWSLEVEVQFYLLAPLLTMVFAIGNAAVRRAVIVATMLFYSFLTIRYDLQMWTIAGQLQYFLAGLLLADLMMTLLSHWPHDWRWDLVSLAGWPAVFFLGTDLINVWLPILTVLLFVAALRGRLMYRFLRLPWVALTGGMCYTIYLWHPLALTASQRLMDRIPGLLPHDFLLATVIHDLIGGLAIAAVSVPLFLWVERPCMDPGWPSRLGRSLSRAVTSLIRGRRLA